MSREWKPGDVAMVRGEFRTGSMVVPTPSVRDAAGEGWHSLAGLAWCDDSDTVDARPLVVIDPENREQVEMLRDLWDGAHTEQQGHAPSQSAKGARGNALQAALREFADPKPPKPAEPTGLGAVVEDADGNRWVRATANTENDCAWVRGRTYKSRGEVWCYESYDMCVQAVKVLSEGVTA